MEYAVIVGMGLLCAGMVCMVCTVAIVYGRPFWAKVDRDGMELESSPGGLTPRARATARRKKRKRKRR